MRSDLGGNPGVDWRRAARRSGKACARSGLLLAVLTVAMLVGPAVPQYEPSYEMRDEPLLATTITDLDIEMRARYVHQWTTDDGTLALLLNGGFRLDMGHRRLTANNAVVWIAPRHAEGDGRKYYDLTVYLSEEAEVCEPGGTVTVDNVLLVRGLRTTGKIIKYQDAHLSGSMEDSPLYQQALQVVTGTAETEPERQGMGVVRSEDFRRAKTQRAPRRIRYRLPQLEAARTPTGEQVFVSTGRVYVAQDGGPDAAALEIRADSAVVFPAPDAAASFLGRGVESESGVEAGPDEETDDDSHPPAAPAVPKEQPAQAPGLLGLDGAAGPGRVRAVYLEGDVVLSLGTRFVRANRLYYDFERERALILDAVFRADVPTRGIPLYIRAAEIRQLSAREFAANHALVTTSEFYTPSYHVGAERVVLRDATARDTQGRATSPIAGTYELTDATLNVGGVPLLWWPRAAGSLQESETLVRRLRTGYSGDFGVEAETSWYLFNLLGVQPPEGYDATFRMDYFSKRGPATGVDLDYERESHYGLFRSYYVHDDGEDNLGPLRRDEEAPTTSERGRVLWRHRHYLPNDWEATLEVSWLSDPNFLEEYQKSEFEEGKEQETLIYLKRARGVEAISLLANWRLLDFVTQTEHLPDLWYRRIGDTFLSPVVLYSEGHLGAVRYRPDDRRFFDRRRFNNDGYSDVTARTGLREEAELPLKLGPVSLVPFASFRGTYWDGQPLDDGGLWRSVGVYGLRGSTPFSRVYDEIESELLDIHRIRHIIQPDFAAWWGHSTARSEELTPFDYGVETIDGFYGMTAGVRQTWQTKRGPQDDRRTVDLLTVNVELGLFGDTDGRRDISNGYADPLRPENSRTRNYVAGDVVYRLSDTTSLLYDFNFDLNDRSFDRQNVSLAVERSPRLAYVFGSRYAGDIDMNLIGGGWNYRLNEKHITAVRGWYDVDSGDLGEISFAYIRKLPRWYVGLNFEYRNFEDDFVVSISLWPEGIPEWTLGSRRFTGLATSTGIRP